MWNYETIRASLIRPKWLKQASLAQKVCSLHSSSSVDSLLPKDDISKDIFDFTTSVDRHCVAERLPAYAQTDQSLCKSFAYSMSVKLLTEHHFEFLSFKGGCTGSSESTLVKMPHC